MPEALEKWSVEMMDRVLPRHMQIIYEINKRFLDEVAQRYPGNDRKLREMSIIQEGPVQMVRMAHLAVIGSHSVNGVAELHSNLIKNACSAFPRVLSRALQLQDQWHHPAPLAA
jgi:glycogen phosphorylase